jgi:amidase
MRELVWWSMQQMARGIASREVSAVELMAAHLAQIERVNPNLNAVIEIDGDRAMDAARDCDRRRPHDHEPLYGVPMTVKGAWDCSGLPNTTGTLGRKGKLATSDATVIARMRRAGAIPIGSTNVPEFSLAFESDNLIYGRTNNPHDVRRTAGGSGGGGAAAIAAGCSPIEIGGDMGGSVRVPAHFCGIAGLKPTLGRVPLTGYVPGPYGVAMLFATAGPLARRVDDLIATLPLIAGPDGVDATVAPAVLRHPGGYRVGSGRIAVHFDNGIVPPTPETAVTVARAADALGVPVEEAMPEGLAECFDIQMGMLGADGGAGLAVLSASEGTTENHPLFTGFVEALQRYRTDAAGLQALIYRRDRYRSNVSQFFLKYDALLCPACAFPAPPHGYSVPWLAGFSYTFAHNLSGCPAVVVRCGTSPEGLPIGVQIVAPPWREDIALAIALRLEESFLETFPRPTAIAAIRR